VKYGLRAEGMASGYVGNTADTASGFGTAGFSWRCRLPIQGRGVVRSRPARHDMMILNGSYLSRQLGVL